MLTLYQLHYNKHKLLGSVNTWDDSHTNVLIMSVLGLVLILHDCQRASVQETSQSWEAKLSNYFLLP